MRDLLICIIVILSMKTSFTQNIDIDSLSIELAFQKADSLKVDTSLYLIKNLYAEKKYEKALKYIIESEKLADALSYKKGIAEVTYYKSLIYAQKNDYINAGYGYFKSKSLFNELSDTIGVARVNNSIGQIEIKRGNYSKGLQYCLSSIKELEKRSLKHELKIAYSNLAKVYYKISAYDKSIEFYLKTSQIQDQLNDKDGINESNLQLANLYSISKEHRKAIDYYETVVANLGNNTNAIKAEIYPKLGGEYLKFRDYEKATKYLLRGYRLNKKVNNNIGLLISLNNLADLNLQNSRFKSAEKQLIQAGALAKKINNTEELLRHYKLMKSLDSTQQKFERAFAWQHKYYNLKDSLESTKILINIEKKASLNNLNLDLNFDKPKVSTKEIIVKNTIEHQENDDKYKKLLSLFCALVALLVLITTFSILLYTKRYKSLKYSKKLKEKNIEIELQNERFSKQNKHLENINNVKDKLFSIVSHDLKDSLSSINGFIDLLKDGSLSREEFDSLIPELSENANNASLLLFNLLNWSKSQMQSLKPSPSLFDIQEVFEDKIKLIEQRMESKGITLVDRSLRDFAFADRSMFEIVVQNLLANALKFSKSGDNITISNHISNGNCIICVADTGIGISKKHTEKIFKGNSYTTMGTNNEKGTGLGLSICKELVELNNGKIWVESSVNVGSAFYVQLPKSKSL